MPDMHWWDDPKNPDRPHDMGNIFPISHNEVDPRAFPTQEAYWNELQARGQYQRDMEARRWREAPALPPAPTPAPTYKVRYQNEGSGFCGAACDCRTGCQPQSEEYMRQSAARARQQRSDDRVIITMVLLGAAALLTVVVLILTYG